jgi:L,D-peptidoglycan transpeptidase YkuD (ErfK/YbiS/YcfS/YnhG family)
MGEIIRLPCGTPITGFAFPPGHRYPSPVRILNILLSVGLGALPMAAGGRESPPVSAEVRQMVVAIGPDWDTHRGKLQCFERRKGGGWQAVSPVVPALFGRNGLAWGRGVREVDAAGPHKAERDGRAPAGMFLIGRVFGHAASAPAGSGVAYLQVTDRDAWVDDPGNPYYNRHVRIPADQELPEWFESQRMRLGDPAYRWLVEVRHNADPPEPGKGSAIFLHVRRGPDRPSAGCTTLPEEALGSIVAWLNRGEHPHYVLLPRSEYLARWKAWGLPSPDQAKGLLE